MAGNVLGIFVRRSEHTVEGVVLEPGMHEVPLVTVL